MRALQSRWRKKSAADHLLLGRRGKRGVAREQGWIEGIGPAHVHELSVGKGVAPVIEADAGKEVVHVAALTVSTPTVQIETGVIQIVENLSGETVVGRRAEQEVGTMTEIAFENGIEIEIEGVDHARDRRLQDRRLIWIRTKWRPGNKRKSKSGSEKLRPISLLSGRLGRKACLSLA